MLDNGFSVHLLVPWQFFAQTGPLNLLSPSVSQDRPKRRASNQVHFQWRWIGGCRDVSQKSQCRNLDDVFIWLWKVLFDWHVSMRVPDISRIHFKERIEASQGCSHRVGVGTWSLSPHLCLLFCCARCCLDSSSSTHPKSPVLKRTLQGRGSTVHSSASFLSPPEWNINKWSPAFKQAV